VPTVIYNGPVGLLAELVDLLQNAGLDADWAPPAPVAGCDTITASIPTSSSEQTLTVVTEWNERYPPFGVHIEP
jgi:hypothetical protein